MNSGSDERIALSAAAASLLTALTLAPLVRGFTWLFVAAITIVTVMVTGIIARQVLRWWPLVALSQLLVLVFAVVLLFARSRVLEGPGALHLLVDLFSDGMAVTRAQAPPVEATPGIVLLVSGSAGLVALLVDVLAVTLRQPALAGLPLLAVYCVPAALLDGGLPWAYFLLAAGGFLLLLSAESGDRVRGWGRMLTSTGRTNEPWRPGSSNNAPKGGGRIAAMTVAVAIVLPALVPGLNNQILGGNNGDGDGDGGRTITRINPILTLRNNLTQTANTPLLRYTTNAANPEPLRIVTDDKFDGNTWSPGAARISSKNRAQDTLPPAPGLTSEVKQTPAQTQIHTLALKETYLPLPYPSTNVDIDGSWLYDNDTLNVIAGEKGQTTERLTYTVDHLVVTPTAQQLEEAGPPPTSVLTSYLAVPPDLDPSIKKTAQDVAKKGTAYEQAVRLQRWFRSDGGFEYTTDAPQVGKSDGSSAAVLAFLRDKRGYCVHFASTMALMARLLDIPARVAVGFLPGERIGENLMQISAHDAHAWPELYFQGVGWVRFEPTPRSGLTTQPDWTIPPSGVLPEDPTPSATESSAPSSSSSATASAAPQRQIDEGAAAASASGGFDVPWRTIAVLLIVLLALSAPRLAYVFAGRRRWASVSSAGGLAEAAWAELRVRLGDLRVRWAVSWTPQAVERRLLDDYPFTASSSSSSSDSFVDSSAGSSSSGSSSGSSSSGSSSSGSSSSGSSSESAAALRRLVSEIEDARYAPPSSEPGRSAAERRADVDLVISVVASTLPPRRQWLVRVWPPSGVAQLTGVGVRVNAAADRAGRQASSAAAQVREKVGRR